MTDKSSSEIIVKLIMASMGEYCRDMFEKYHSELYAQGFEEGVAVGRGEVR